MLTGVKIAEPHRFANLYGSYHTKTFQGGFSMNKPSVSQLTPERIRELFDYCPTTGNLYVKKKRKWGPEVGSKVGYKGGYGCLSVCIEYKRYKVHRLVFAHVYGYWPNGEIDHIDGNPLNNRIENLRDVTHSANQKNMKLRKDNKSGFPGVEWNKANNKWRVRVRHNGKWKEIGSFQDYGDAVAARKIAHENYGYHKNHGRN